MARDLVEARAEDAGLSSAGLDAIDAALQGLIDTGQLAGAATLVARHGLVARRRFPNLERRHGGSPSLLARHRFRTGR